jgi:hypothetical protein
VLYSKLPPLHPPPANVKLASVRLGVGLVLHLGEILEKYIIAAKKCSDCKISHTFEKRKKYIQIFENRNFLII